MALNQWFKFYGGEYLSDPKIASLSAQERSCWITLLSLASMSSTPGTIEYLTVEVLLDKSGVPFDPYNPENWNAALGVLSRFEKMKMIKKSDEGVIEIMNWKKRQETALTNAERQAKYRYSKGNNEKVTETVTKVTLDKMREDKNTSEFEDEPRRVEVPEEDRPKRTSTAKYPHSKEVFSWFPKDLYEPSWKINTALLKHSELLYSRGESKVRSIIKFCLANESDSFFPTWQDPLTLERNWNKIVRFADKND